MLKDVISNDGEYIIFNGSYLEFYIPTFYFESKFAENYGSSINVFGIFNVRVFSDKNTPMKLETLNIPSRIYIYPTEGEKKDLQLIDGGEVESYYVAKFYKGNRIMPSKITQDASNVELFIDFLFRGKVPKTIPYNSLLNIWQKNLSLNGVKIEVTSTVLEIIIAEIYRDKKKPEQTFAKVIGKDPSVSPYDYKTANIREICSRNSTFAALTFEDLDSMITTSLNINKYNKQETESPIEKIIKM